MVKISLNTVTRECIADSNFLGFEGENQANVLDFSFSGERIDGTAVLNIKRGKDTGFVAVDKVGNGYQLPVRSSLLSQVGDITFQFVITTPSGAIMKFDSFVMTVEDAIDTDVPLPEEYPSWIEMANYKLAEVDTAITRANSTSNQLLQDKENGVFDGKDGIDGRNGINGLNGKDGTNGVNGKDGVSPTFKTEQVEGGAKITINDVEGTHVVTLKDGQDGVNGKDGTNGVSPTVTTAQTTTGATITITDKSGTHTATLLNGKDGKDGKDGTMSFEDLTEEQKATLKGDKGDKGDTGEAGANGLTPFIGSNGNWWIGETDTGVKAEGSGSGGGSSYREVDLIDSPVEYNISKTLTNINQDLVFNDSVLNYDEIVFFVDVYSKDSVGYYNGIHVSKLKSEIRFSNSDSPSVDSDSFYLFIDYYTTNLGLNYMQAGVHWKNETTLRVRNTINNNASYTKFRIKSVKGIKY